MVPGFLVIEEGATALSEQPTQALVALASPWDFDNGSGRRTKVCGNAYSNTKCVPPVLWCQNCRQCHWSDSYGLFEDCAFWYPCGVCNDW
jgi:hypothetical protein